LVPLSIRWNDTLADGFLILGSTGEASSLTFKERVEVLQTVKKEASPRKQLFAGTGSSSLKDTKDLTAIAQDLGYDAAMVVTPYYYLPRMTDSALEAYYTAVADAAKIPIILYNNPKTTGVTMSVPLIKKLSQHPNIVGIKDASGSLDQLSVLIEETRETEFDVLGAYGSTFLPSLAVGCPGSITSLAAVVPNHMAKIAELVKEKQYDAAAELQRHLVPLSYAISNKYGVAGLKYILNKTGYKVGPVRLPLLPLSEKDTAALDKLILQYQL
jgi:4-hydroxy-2-oxoglutarate aldolase